MSVGVTTDQKQKNKNYRQPLGLYLIISVKPLWTHYIKCFSGGTLYFRT